MEGILGGGCDLVMVRVGERIEGGIVGKIRKAGQGGARDEEMVVVERPPVVRACEVGRKMD